MNREAIQNYFANADDLNNDSAVELKEMIGNYPYCSLLYLLLARAHKNVNSDQLQEVVEKAAAYSPDREGLYLFLHTPGQLPAASEKVSVSEPASVTAEALAEEPIAEAPATEAPTAEGPEVPVADAPAADGPAAEGPEAPVADADASGEPVAEQPEEAPSDNTAQEVVPADSEESVGEESVEEGSVEEESVEDMPTPESAAEASEVSESGQAKAVAGHAPTPASGGEPRSRGVSLARKPAGAQDLALNIDDQLPRTFTFWLRRIRQVTEGEPDYSVKITDVLESNYYQELITRKTEKEYLSSAPVKFDLDKKEDRIIARFIQEDPQVIKPTMTIQAKEEASESAGPEDDDEMISETLAQIYIDQDLTDKAIRVYEKLSLKFPEKSAYFAGLIEKLNK